MSIISFWCFPSTSCPSDYEKARALPVPNTNDTQKCLENRSFKAKLNNIPALYRNVCSKMKWQKMLMHALHKILELHTIV